MERNQKSDIRIEKDTLNICDRVDGTARALGEDCMAMTT